MGKVVLAHLYRELLEFIWPQRANLVGCLYLLQVWSYEHLHVGRPTLHVSYPLKLISLSINFSYSLFI